MKMHGSIPSFICERPLSPITVVVPSTQLPQPSSSAKPTLAYTAEPLVSSPQPGSAEKKREKVENADVHLILVLDESGSMSSQSGDVIRGVNNTIDSQRRQTNEDTSVNNVLFSLVTFSNDVKFKIVSADVTQIAPITERDYQPNGGTALLDALGTCMQRFENHTRVIMVIATDGRENCSTDYTQSRVKAMISHCTDQLGWQFIYICENLESLREGEGLGMGARQGTDVRKTPSGKSASYLSDPRSIETLHHIRSAMSHPNYVPSSPIYRPSSPNNTPNNAPSGPVYYPSAPSASKKQKKDNDV
jgi:hypothetical protein